jgi:UDP-N-acetylmuramyl pentapeptide synthase
MKKQFRIDMEFPSSNIKLTKEQAEVLGIDLTKDEIEGNLKTCGVWNVPVSYSAICVSGKLGIPEGRFVETFLEKTVYGNRTMTNVRQSGYCLEGYVSIGGKKYSAFTSSELFEVDGKLINVAVIHARVR